MVPPGRGPGGGCSAWDMPVWLRDATWATSAGLLKGPISPRPGSCGPASRAQGTGGQWSLSHRTPPGPTPELCAPAGRVTSSEDPAPPKAQDGKQEEPGKAGRGGGGGGGHSVKRECSPRTMLSLNRCSLRARGAKCRDAVRDSSGWTGRQTTAGQSRALAGTRLRGSCLHQTTRAAGSGNCGPCRKLPRRSVAAAFAWGSWADLKNTTWIRPGGARPPGPEGRRPGPGGELPPRPSPLPSRAAAQPDAALTWRAPSTCTTAPAGASCRDPAGCPGNAGRAGGCAARRPLLLGSRSAPAVV